MPAIKPFENLVDMYRQSVERFASRPLFGTKQHGTWTYVTYREFGELVDRFRAGLASLGVGEGDGVAVISDNRVEWAVGAYATYGLAARYIPMYQKQNASDWEYIVKDSGAKVLLVANDEIAAKAQGFLESVDQLEAIVSFGSGGSGEGVYSYRELLDKGAAHPVEPASPSPETLCGLIYTSGTTGNPKGVMLSHGNITSNVNAVQTLFPMEREDRSLSFLPWAHSFGQTCELHSLLSYGASIAIAESVDKLVANLSEVRPTLLFSVPRIFNRIYDGLNKKMAAAGGLKLKLFEAAMANAKTRRELADKGQSNLIVKIKHAIFDKLVFSKVRERLGGRLRYAFSGGAAISKEVAEFIDNIGVTVYEGYGLSETSPIATANYPDNQRLGSVGKAIPKVEIIIDTAAVGGTMGDQGEIVIKGPNIMQGYHNLPEQTANVMRPDGGFRTGDLGRVDSEGFVYITGRIKEQYKLENGKYVVPAPLEEQLKLSGFVNQAMVFGMNKPYNVAIIVPDEEALVTWAKAQGLPTGDLAALCKHAKVQALYRAECDKQAGSVFKGFERIKAFRLIVEEFSTDNDMLTPTLKLKRRNVIGCYQSILDELYAEIAATKKA